MLKQNVCICRQNAVVQKLVEVIEQETGETLSISQGEIMLVTATSAVSHNVVTVVALDTQFSEIGKHVCIFLLLCKDKPME